MFINNLLAAHPSKRPLEIRRALVRVASFPFARALSPILRRRLLAAFSGFILVLSFPALAGPMFTMGAGVEGRINHSVNTEEFRTDGVGQLYTSVSWVSWSLLWEISRMQDETRSGNYSIQKTGIDTMLWGRVCPWPELKWTPFVGAGLGWSFRSIATTFGSAHDERWTDGGQNTGLDVGVTTFLFKNWNIEFEMRTTKNEFWPDLIFSGVGRTGLSF